MERLFSPCTRLHDLLESQGRRRPGGLQELNLDVSTEELLSAERAFTYADVYAMLGNEDTVAWLTPQAALVRRGGGAVNYLRQLAESYRFYFNADGKDIFALARSPGHLLEICDVVVRLLAASVVHSVSLHSLSARDGALINAPTLAYLMEQCQSLKALTLHNLKMDESHCRVLGAYTRPDLEIALDSCKLTSAGAVALAEVLGRNQGPTKFHSCDMDYSVLADGLRGNSRLKSLRDPIFRNRGDADQERLAIAGALKENKGLVDLDLWYSCTMSDEMWGVTCDSLKTHPTLQVLDLRAGGASWAPVALTSRMQVLVDTESEHFDTHTAFVSPL
jgi:hypothetical protein